MKQSETKIINRSQINLNPINPKRHTDEQIKQQKKNLKKVINLNQKKRENKHLSKFKLILSIDII